MLERRLQSLKARLRHDRARGCQRVSFARHPIPSTATARSSRNMNRNASSSSAAPALSAAPSPIVLQGRRQGPHLPPAAAAARRPCSGCYPTSRWWRATHDVAPFARLFEGADAVNTVGVLHSRSGRPRPRLRARPRRAAAEDRRRLSHRRACPASGNIMPPGAYSGRPVGIPALEGGRRRDPHRLARRSRWTILQPSVVRPAAATQLPQPLSPTSRALFPVLPLAGATTARFQPVYVEDAAE